MVDATSKATTIRAKAVDPNMDESTKEFASFTVSLYDLLTSVVEKAIIPLADRPPPLGRGRVESIPRPSPPNRRREKKN
jgi:hypothetical protein